ncbi:MAG: adenine deaminase, partial [Muribaculaceae bacterium]|nr:adenine deaminase [Muribaculaceae bacterium]
PGFIDSHVHIESSMLLPTEFAKVAVRHGTIGTVSDPHEIGNVLGLDGVRYMIKESKRVPFNIMFGAPSCVPSCSSDVETNGAKIDAKGIEELMSMDEIGYLTEMMDYVGVLNHDPEVMAKIESAHKHGKPVDGHALELSYEQRLQYAQTGITTDHECSTTDEGRDCINVGMKLIIREGSAAKNYEALSPLIDEYPDKVMFCTDDYNASDLLNGHINLMVKRALSDGYYFWNVMQAACVNPQFHYGMNWGLLQKGDPASFIIIDAITSDFNVLKTILKGTVVYDSNCNENLLPIEADDDKRTPNKFVASPITADDINFDLKSDKLYHIINSTDGSLLTKHEYRAYKPGEDQKIVVYNRYKEGEKPVVGLINGFNMINGAMAGSVAHDCHNIVAIGSNDDDIVRAINRVIEIKGGLVAISSDEMGELPLPVAGVLSPLSVEQVALKNNRLYDIVRKAGCKMSAPFITMAFMCLPVIPELKITDKHLWDSSNMKPISN